MANKIYIEPPESERKYRRLTALGKELGVPVPQVFLEMEVKMPDGKVVHHHKQRSHSWIRNAYNVMFSALAGVDVLDNTYTAGKMSIKIPAGTIYGLANPVTQYQGNFSLLLEGTGYRASAATITNGIVVGYDTTTAESFEDYTLINPILEGITNDGHHLNFILSQPYVISWSAPTMSVALVRFMNNNSGGNVVVGEVGLIENGYINTIKAWMMARDHLGAPVTIPNTGQLKVTYTIQLVYP
jgi:hypothetical protein